jgi:hypothetical protein
MAPTGNLRLLTPPCRVDTASIILPLAGDPFDAFLLSSVLDSSSRLATFITPATQSITGPPRVHRNHSRITST